MIPELFCFVRSFIKDIIGGFESGFYKFGNQIDLSKDMLTNNNPKKIMPMLICTHLNECYKSIILKNNPRANKFMEMRLMCGYSEICLLNLIATLAIDTCGLMDRSNFDIPSYDLYMKSVDDAIENVLNMIKFDAQLNHVCNGIDISVCDPNKPMFII
jgi:hypothetical protein